MSWLIRKALEAVFPRSEALPGVADTDLAAFVARFRREAPPLMKVGFYLGVAVFHLSPLLTIYVPVPAFVLPQKLLDRHAYRAATSKVYLLKQCMFMVKLVAGLCWGAHPTVRERFGQPALPPDPGSWRGDGGDA